MQVPAIRRIGGEQPISFEMLPPASTKENPHNARKHSRKQLAKLRGSLAEFGFITPVVIDENGQLLGGHARVAAAKELGIEAIPVVRASHLSEAQKRGFTVADNRLAQLASWNKESLKRELEFLSDLDIDCDFSAIGFDAAEVEFILERNVDANDRASAHPIPIEAPAISKPGDLWRLGEHLLYCGSAHPHQADAIIRCWQADTGADAIDGLTGERFYERERVARGR